MQYSSFSVTAHNEKLSVNRNRFHLEWTPLVLLYADTTKNLESIRSRYIIKPSLLPSLLPTSTFTTHTISTPGNQSLDWVFEPWNTFAQPRTSTFHEPQVQEKGSKLIIIRYRQQSNKKDRHAFDRWMDTAEPVAIKPINSTCLPSGCRQPRTFLVYSKFNCYNKLPLYPYCILVSCHCDDSI